MKKLILLHGLMGSREQFEKLETLLKQDFDVHTINFSGHGMAEFYFPEFSVEAFSEQVVSYLDSRQIEKADFFGYGIGGYVALYLTRFFSDRVNQVMTLATKLDWNPDVASKEVKLLDAEMLEERFPQFVAHLIERHGDKKWKMLLEKSHRLLTALGDEPLLKEDDFRRMENRIRFCAGDQDKMFGLEEQLGLVRQMKNGSMAVFPETKHSLESVDVNRLYFELKDFFID
jgi:pimeloyl-ACP methyl ester carboxylesterase